MQNNTPIPSASVLHRAAWASGLLLALLALVSSVAAAQPRLHLVAPARAEVGRPLTLTLTVQGEGQVGGYEATLLFDGAAAHLHGLFQRGNDLHAQGREVLPLGPVAVTGGVRFGAVSCSGTCREPQPMDAAVGPGAVRLATLQLVPDQEGVLEVRLAAVHVVNRAGETVRLAVIKETIRVQVGESALLHVTPPAPATAPSIADLPLDATGDGHGSVADLMEAALAWESDATTSAPNVATLQRLAGRIAALPDPLAADAALAPMFIVNSVGDTPDNHIGNGICETAAGDCTLRAAIHEANARDGPNTIGFNIPGAGPHTILLTRPLTTLNDASGPTTIDGYTQPGSVPNNAALGSNAVLRVQITGAQVTPIDGLRITTPGNVVRGLALFGLERAIWLYGAEAADNRIVGNFIGTDAAGTFAACCETENGHGVRADQGAHDNLIGDTALADRNIISGNAARGVGFWHEGTEGNRIINNVVGLSPDGSRRLENRSLGLDINFGASENIIGGTGPGERNVISGNRWSGIEISHNAQTRSNVVAGNFVGTDLTGMLVSPDTANLYAGIWLDDGVRENLIHDNVIANSALASILLTRTTTAYNRFWNNYIGVARDGTPLPTDGHGIMVEGSHNVFGPKNQIAYHKRAGICVSQEEGDFNTITQNAIFSNDSLGIDLGPQGTVNPNDPGDADTGPNQQLNMPIFSTATNRAVTGQGCAGCRIEVFTAAPDGTGHGEGQAWLGSAVAGADRNFVVRPVGIVGGMTTITATATDAAGNTSEFAPNVVIELAPGPQADHPLYFPLLLTVHTLPANARTEP